MFRRKRERTLARQHHRQLLDRLLRPISASRARPRAQMHSSRVSKLQLDHQSQLAERHLGQGRGANRGRTRVRTAGLQEVLVKRVQTRALLGADSYIEKELRAKRRILISARLSCLLSVSHV